MEKKPIPIKSVFTHTFPHVDELIAILLLQNYGENFFPGIKKARISFTKERDIKGDFLLRQQILCLGIGGGVFDEHGRGGNKKSETAASLVAKYLEIDNRPAIKKLLNYALNVDKKGSGDPFDIANMVKDFYQIEPTESREEVFQWAMKALQAALNFNPAGEKIQDFNRFLECVEKMKLLQDKEFKHNFPLDEYAQKIKEGKIRHPFGFAVLTEILCRYNEEVGQEWFCYALQIKIEENKKFLKAIWEFNNKAKIITLKRWGDNIRIALIESDNFKMVRAFRSPQTKEETDILIQRSSRGNIGVYTNKRKKINLGWVAAYLRATELHRRKKLIPKDDYYLRQPGDIKEVPHWYYLKEGECLLNGSLTADKPPTIITPEEIVNIIKLALSSQLPQECYKSKKCSFNQCLFYPLKANQCFGLRNKDRKTAKKNPKN